jgi:hypothetical protein
MSIPTRRLRSGCACSAPLPPRSTRCTPVVAPKWPSPTATSSPPTSSSKHAAEPSWSISALPDSPTRPASRAAPIPTQHPSSATAEHKLPPKATGTPSPSQWPRRSPGSHPPTDAGGFLDLSALEYVLRDHPITKTRPLVVTQILDLLNTPPPARSTLLGTWLDSASGALSQVTTPSPGYHPGKPRPNGPGNGPGQPSSPDAATRRDTLLIPSEPPSAPPAKRHRGGTVAVLLLCLLVGMFVVAP